MRLLLACLCALSSPAAAAFTDHGAGARAPGMGGAFAAVADDVYASHYNPAGLAQLARPELGFSYSRLLMGLGDHSVLSTSYLGYAHPMKSAGTAGVSVQQFALNGSLYQEQAFSGLYARRAAEVARGDLFLGGALRYLRRSFGALPESANAYSGIAATGRPDPVLSGRSAVGAVDADIGALYRQPGGYGAALVVRHLAQPNVGFADAGDRLGIETVAAASYASLLSNLSLQHETRPAPDGGRDQTLIAGAERWFPRLFVGDIGARGSLAVGSREYREATAGFSYRSRRFQVDYAFAMPISGAPSGTGTHRFGLTMRLGSPAAPDESVELVLEAMRALKGGAVPNLKGFAQGLPPSQKAVVEEYAAQASALLAEGRYQAAAERLGRALALNPGDDQLLRGYGRLHQIADLLKELPDYKADPVKSALHEGAVAYVNGNAAAAMEKFGAALSYDPKNAKVREIVERMERTTGIARSAAPARSEEELRLDRLVAKAEAALDAGRYDEAVALAKEVVAADPKRQTAWQVLGVAHFATGNYDESGEAWERAERLERAPAVRALMREYFRSVQNVKRSAAARAAARTAAPAAPKADPAEAERLYARGLSHYTAGQLKEARDAFERALRLDPSHTGAAKALLRLKEEMDKR